MSDDVGLGAASPSQRVARLMDGYLTTQMLYVAAKLGIAEVLAAGPSDAETVACAVQAQPTALQRIMRGLAAESLLEEDGGGRFSLTALGTCLRGDVPGSQRGAIIARGEVYYRAMAGLLAAVQQGGTAFEHVCGTPFFEYLRQDPEMGAAFQGSMADRAHQEAADVVAAYDFRAFEVLVDVGGGHGILLETILNAVPGLRGVLLDRPPVAEGARTRLAAAGLTGRCTVVPGDFFAAVPAGGDAYLLSRVIHDWEDDEARRILACCREVMDDRATLLLVEAILPELARDQPAAIRMDLHMLALLGSRERTAAEFERLLASAGFDVVRVVPTGSPAGLGVVEAKPLPRTAT